MADSQGLASPCRDFFFLLFVRARFLRSCVCVLLHVLAKYEYWLLIVVTCARDHAELIKNNSHCTHFKASACVCFKFSCSKKALEDDTDRNIIRYLSELGLKIHQFPNSKWKRLLCSRDTRSINSSVLLR